jgi:hypothetical protein
LVNLIGPAGTPFYPNINPSQSGLAITNSTIDSSVIGGITPSTGTFTNILTTTGQITTSPAGNTDIANKFYVDQIAQGLSPKQAVKCGTSVSITLSGLQTIDGYTTLAGDRVLVKNQGTSSQNGIYNASASAWTRSADMDVWAEVPGAYTVILNGGQAQTAWVSTSSDTGTINVTPITFVQFSGNGTYYAGTGLTLTSNTFSITNTGVTAASVGSASKTLTATVNAQGQLTALADTNIAIAATQITSGTIDSARISGSYTGITGVGTLTAGVWNGSTIGVAYGGTGAATFAAGYLKASGTTAFSTVTQIPTTDLSGTITNAQLANSTISGVSLGSNLFSLTIGSGLSGTSYNGSAAVTITNSAPMVYPGSGIPNSTGSAWGTSYAVSGSGNVALTTGATLSNPTISNYEIWTGTSAPSYAEGRQWYDSTAHALAYYNDSATSIVHIGQDIQVKVINNTGSTIANGAPVYITSTSSGQTYPNIALAKADVAATSAVIGLTNGSIANGAIGYVTSQGGIDNVNTGTFTVGQVLYLSPYSAGQLMNTIPPTGITVQVGVVSYVDSSAGKIYVKQTTPLNVPASIISGQVALANGGTAANLTAVAGGVVYSGASALAISAAGTTGQVLTSNGTSAPSWSTPTAYATVTDDTTTNATRYPLFASATAGNLATEYVSSTKYQFNPSTGLLTATGFSGSGANLTSIPNSALVNSSVTIGSTTISLGGTATTIAGLTSVTSTTFVGALSGNATSATTATNATNATNTGTTDDTTTNAVMYPVWKTSTSGNLPEYTSSTKLKFNPSTGALTASQLVIAP